MRIGRQIAEGHGIIGAALQWAAGEYAGRHSRRPARPA
jgi:hypothetical protein